MQPQKTNADPFEFDHFHTLILCLCLNLEVPVNAKDPSPLLLLVQLGASWLRTCVSYISNTLQHISGSSSVAFMSETGEGQILPPPPFFFSPYHSWQNFQELFKHLFSLYLEAHMFIQSTAAEALHIWDACVHRKLWRLFNRNPSENAAVGFFPWGGLLAKSTPCLSGQSNLSLVVPSNQGQTAAQHLINK